MTGHAQALVQGLLFPGEVIEQQHKAMINLLPGFTRKLSSTLYVTTHRVFIADIDSARDGIIPFAFWGEIYESPHVFNEDRRTILAVSAPGRGLPQVRVHDSVAVAVIAVWQQRHRHEIPEVRAAGLIEPSRHNTLLYPGRCGGCGWPTQTLASCSACGRHLEWSSPIDYLSYAAAHPDFVFGPAITAKTDPDRARSLSLIINHAVAAYGEGQPHFAFGLSEWISAVREGRSVAAGTYLDIPMIAAYMQANDARIGWIRLRGLPNATSL